MAAHRRLDANLAERVELVDEDDAGRLALGLAEQVADPGSADADEHLDELRAAQAEEGHVGLAGDGAREQRLARARRPDQQDALRDPAADARVLLRRLEELDDLAQLLLRLVDAGDVAELHLDVVIGVDLGAAAGERHDAALGARHPAEEEDPQRNHEPDRDHPAEDLRDPAAGNLATVLDAVLFELFDELGIGDADGDEGLALAIVGLQSAEDAVFCDRRLHHLAVADLRLEVAVGDGVARPQREEHALADRQDRQYAEGVPHGRAGARPPRHPLVAGAAFGEVRSGRRRVIGHRS